MNFFLFCAKQENIKNPKFTNSGRVLVITSQNLNLLIVLYHRSILIYILYINNFIYYLYVFLSHIFYTLLIFKYSLIKHYLKFSLISVASISCSKNQFLNSLFTCVYSCKSKLWKTYLEYVFIKFGFFLIFVIHSILQDFKTFFFFRSRIQEIQVYKKDVHGIVL